MKGYGNMNKKLSKKLLAMLCLALLAFSALTGCTKGSAAGESTDTDPSSAAVLSAYIVENDGNSLLVSSDDGLFFVSTENAAVEKNKKELSVSDLKTGMTVKIGYDGAVLESYPGQIANVETIKVISAENDKISLYKEAFKYIFDEREKLEDEKTIALDFSGLKSLSDSQKNALEYVLSNYFSTKTEADVIRGSYEELSLHGRIKDYDFPEGVILSAKENDNGSFSINWWKSGLCASGFDNCTAKLHGGEWKINYDGAWIS